MQQDPEQPEHWGISAAKLQLRTGNSRQDQHDSTSFYDSGKDDDDDEDKKYVNFCF